MATKRRPVTESKPAKPVVLVGGLEGLGPQHAAVDPRKVTLEDLMRVTLRSAKEVGEQLAEQIRQGAGIAEWINTNLPKLEEFEAASGAVQASMRVEAERASMFIDGLLRHDDPVVRRGAFLAVMTYKLGKQYNSPDQAVAMFTELVRDGLLIRSQKPDSSAALPGGVIEKSGRPVTLFGDTYQVSRNVELSNKDISDLRKQCRELLSRTASSVKEDRLARTREMCQRRTISLEQCRDHVPGLCIFVVDPEQVRDKRDEGRTFTRQGGWLLMKSDGDRLYIEDVVNDPCNGALGRFEGIVREMMELPNKPFVLVDKAFSGQEQGFILSHMIIRAVKNHLIDSEKEESNRALAFDAGAEEDAQATA